MDLDALIVAESDACEAGDYAAMDYYRTLIEQELDRINPGDA